MVFILIGVVAAAFGLLDYFEIVDTPTPLVLTGVGAVTILAAIAQLQKQKKSEPGTVAPDLALQMANGVAQTPAVPTMPGAPANSAVPANGVAPNGGVATGTVAASQIQTSPEKQGLWSKMNKPVGGKEPKVKDKGKHRSRRDKRDAIQQPPAVQPANVAITQPGIATGVALAEPGEKPSLWKRLNKPVGKGADGPEREGRKSRRRDRDEDNGPLFPNGVPETPDPFATAPLPAHAAPGMPAPGMPVAEAPLSPIADHQAVVPGAQAEADLWQEQQVAANGGAQVPPVPAVPQPPAIEQPMADEAGYPQASATGTATAVALADPSAQSSRRGLRVCNYCWEPNGPTAVECGSCGAAL